MTAIVVKSNGRMVSKLVLHAIAGWLKAAHNYDAEVVDLEER